MLISPCNEHHGKCHFIWEKWGLQSFHFFFVSIQKISCGFSLEPPQCNVAPNANMRITLHSIMIIATTSMLCHDITTTSHQCRCRVLWLMRCHTYSVSVNFLRVEPLKRALRSASLKGCKICLVLLFLLIYMY